MFCACCTPERNTKEEDKPLPKTMPKPFKKEQHACKRCYWLKMLEIRHINSEQCIIQQQFTLKQHRIKNNNNQYSPHAMMPHSRNTKENEL